MSDQVMHIQAKNNTVPRIAFLDCSLRPSEYLSDNRFDLKLREQVRNLYHSSWAHGKAKMISIPLDVFNAIFPTSQNIIQL